MIDLQTVASSLYDSAKIVCAKNGKELILQNEMCIRDSNSGIPQHEIENIARILLPDILAFYESEEGKREFAEWQAARDGAKTDKDSNGENVA